jgi:hypothetical protein
MIHLCVPIMPVCADRSQMLYKRYMQQNDIYVHADLSGASTCIIKNPTDDRKSPSCSHVITDQSHCSCTSAHTERGRQSFRVLQQGVELEDIDLCVLGQVQSSLQDCTLGRVPHHG